MASMVAQGVARHGDVLERHLVDHGVDEPQLLQHNGGQHEPELRVVVAADDRQLEVSEFDDQPPLGLLGAGETRPMLRCRRR